MDPQDGDPDAHGDGDGHIDVVMNAGEAIHYGDGLGGFGPLMPQTAGVDADAVVVGDAEGAWEQLLDDFVRQFLQGPVDL